VSYSKPITAYTHWTDLGAPTSAEFPNWFFVAISQIAMDNKMDVPSTELLKALRSTINDLENAITGTAYIATTVMTMHRDMLSELRSQLAALEKSHLSIREMQEIHLREMAIIDEKINAVLNDESCLQLDDHQDTIYMLHQPKKALIPQYKTACEAWKKANAKEEAHSKALIDRAHSLLAHATEAVGLEETVRAVVEIELKQRLATSLLEDGILIWVSQTNQFAILMTECVLRISGYQLIIAPTHLCFDPQSLRNLHDRYRLDHTSTDMGKREITIDLRDVEELQFTSRRANIPGTSDEKSPHYEPAKHHQCILIRTDVGMQYFLADRKNESRDKGWGSLQGVPDSSPSLLYRKLTALWQEAKDN
jgi:hypothetical protein